MCGLPPSSNARLFDETVLNHNILWSVKKKINILGIWSYFFGDGQKVSDWGGLSGAILADDSKRFWTWPSMKNDCRDGNKGEMIDLTAKGE